MSNSAIAFETITIEKLSIISGGQNGQATPPNAITTGDVLDVGAKAAKTVLRPWSAAFNIPQAYNQFNDSRLGSTTGTNLGSRFLNAGLGMFGIDPLKGR